MKVGQIVRVADDAKGRHTSNQIGGRRGRIVDLHEEQPQWVCLRFDDSTGKAKFFDWVLRSDVTVIG